MKNELPYILGITFSSLIMITCLITWFIFYWKRKRKENIVRKKGKISENFVNNEIKLWSYKNNAMFIPSSMFKYNENIIFEVDGILITQRALIAVEVKSINAQTIEGKGNEKTWFKIMGNEKFPIKSPIMQNDKHLDHILKLTNIKLPMVSLIIFDSNSTNNLQIENIPSHALVIKSNEIQTTLDGINSLLLPKINNNEMQASYNKLMKHKTESEEDRKLLISYSKEFDEKTFTI